MVIPETELRNLAEKEYWKKDVDLVDVDQENFKEPDPDPMETTMDSPITDSYNPLQEYEITLQFLSSGMVIIIGCKKIAFTTKEEGMAQLRDYVDNPKQVYEKWMKFFNLN